GVYAAMSNGDGTFSGTSLVLGAFGSGENGGGWSSQNIFPRQLADINGDGADDIIGFGGAGAYVALSDGNGGFAPASLELAAFGADANAGSWINDTRYPRLVTDLNGDGIADILGIGQDGVYVSMTHPALLG